MWEAPPVVGSDERVGRRIFNDRLRGTDGQPEPPLGNIDWFIEKKSAELSVDRIGQGKFKKDHRSYLTSCAKEHSSKIHGQPSFAGWACIDVFSLRKSWKNCSANVKASPIYQEGVVENKFHADIFFPDSSSECSSALVMFRAFYLKERWALTSIIEPPDGN